MTETERAAASEAGVGAVVAMFNAAFNSRDVDAVMSLMTEDCVFESTAPPDGRRYVGSAEVRACWEELFAASPEATFAAEETLVVGDRAVVPWTYRFGDDDAAGHVRGVDLFRVRDQKVAEKLSYVKG